MNGPGFPWLGLLQILARALLEQPRPRPVLRPPSPATESRAELLLMAAALQPPRRRTCGNPQCPACAAFRRSIS